jgi:SAM-dependent methyltransferase
MHSYLWVDASGEMLRIARQDWGDFFQQTDMRELSSIWKKFDTVFFVASFHHVIHTASQKKVLEELRTLLAPDGIAVFLNWHLLTQKMREKYPNREGSVCHIPFAGNPREYYAFSQEELEQLFQEQSYRVQYSGYTQSQQNIITIGSPLV